MHVITSATQPRDADGVALAEDEKSFTRIFIKHPAQPIANRTGFSSDSLGGCQTRGGAGPPVSQLNIPGAVAANALAEQPPHLQVLLEDLPEPIPHHNCEKVRVASRTRMRSLSSTTRLVLRRLSSAASFQMSGRYQISAVLRPSRSPPAQRWEPRSNRGDVVVSYNILTLLVINWLLEFACVPRAGLGFMITVS